MKVFCFGDVHFGGSRYKVVQEQEDRLVEWVGSWVKNFMCREIVILGDLFKDKVPDPRVKDRVGFFLDELTRLVDKVWVVAGNHDYYDKGCEESGLAIYRFIDGCEVVDEDVVVDGNKVLVPWKVARNWLSSLDDLEGKFVFTHAEFREMVMWEGDEQISVDVFREAELVVAGHIHDRKQLRNVLYVGVPFKRSFSDLGTGGVVVDLANGQWWRVYGYGVDFVKGLEDDLSGCIVRVGKEEEVEEAKRRGALYVEYVPEVVRGYDVDVSIETEIKEKLDLVEVVREYGRKVLGLDEEGVEWGVKFMEEVK